MPGLFQRRIRIPTDYRRPELEKWITKMFECTSTIMDEENAIKLAQSGTNPSTGRKYLETTDPTLIDFERRREFIRRYKSTLTVIPSARDYVGQIIRLWPEGKPIFDKMLDFLHYKEIIGKEMIKKDEAILDHLDQVDGRSIQSINLELMQVAKSCDDALIAFKDMFTKSFE